MKWSENSLREWAAANLEDYGFRKDKDRQLFLACTAQAKRKSRFGVVELSVLRILLSASRQTSPFRPDRSERDREKYAASDMITKAELADEIECSDGRVCGAVKKINRIARRCADGRKLILFNSRGIGINVSLFDAVSARSYSERQANSQIDAHAQNIDLANQTAAGCVARERIRKFQSMTPDEQSLLLEKAGIG